MRHPFLISLIFVALSFPVGCSTGKDSTVSTTVEAVTTGQTISTPPAIKSNSLPKAQIYKTNIDVTQNVPVTLNVTGTGLLSYPAPSDISAQSAPIALDSCFFLDRRGITQNTAFTSYTYDQYARLKQPPTPEELLKSIIPEAKVIELVQLPFTTAVAEADTAEVNRLIRAGLPGCKTIVRTPVPPIAPVTLAHKTSTLTTDSMITTLSPIVFDKNIHSGTSIQLLDVRTPQEFRQEHIAGATNINVQSDDFASKATVVLSKDKPVYVYCRSGKRSLDAAGVLAKYGFRVINLDGGILGWMSEGLPVVRP